jgi:hypothetical protein
MEDRKPPTWDEIRGLIDRVDQVCRESEQLRAHAERMLRRPRVWPDRRREPAKHSQAEPFRGRREDDATPEGNQREI